MASKEERKDQEMLLRYRLQSTYDPHKDIFRVCVFVIRLVVSASAHSTRPARFDVVGIFTVQL